jgi:hypothetical protein
MDVVERIKGLRKRHREVIELIKYEYMNDDDMDLLDMVWPSKQESPEAALAYLERCIKRTKPSYKSGTPLYRFYRLGFADLTNLPDSLIDLVLDYRFVRTPWTIVIEQDARPSWDEDEDNSHWEDYADFAYDHRSDQTLISAGQIEIFSQSEFDDNDFIRKACADIQLKESPYAFLIQPLLPGDWKVPVRRNQFWLKVDLEIKQAAEKPIAEKPIVEKPIVFELLSDLNYRIKFRSDCNGTLACTDYKTCGFMYAPVDNTPNILAIVLFLRQLPSDIRSNAPLEPPTTHTTL